MNQKPKRWLDRVQNQLRGRLERKRAKPAKMRKVFDYTEESEQYLIRKGKRKYFVRFGRFSDNDTIRRYVAHRIMALLHPRVSIRPVGLVVERVRMQDELFKSARIGMVSEIVRNRTREYKSMHRRFYWGIEEISNYWNGVNAASPIVRKLYNDGFEVNTFDVNVIQTTKGPVFAEILDVNTRSLKQALERKKIPPYELERIVLDTPFELQPRVRKMLGHFTRGIGIIRISN